MAGTEEAGMVSVTVCVAVTVPQLQVVGGGAAPDPDFAS